jgi:hypothetical protein
VQSFHKNPALRHGNWQGMQLGILAPWKKNQNVIKEESM